MSEPERLTEDDWATLLIVEEFQLGNTVLYLEPFGAYDMARAWKTISGLKKKPVNIEDLPEVILQHCPQLVGKASGLHQDDVKRLLEKRPAVALELVAKLVEINLNDYNTLVKNLEASTGLENLTTLLGLVRSMSPSS
jgi:hypothetical protein